MLVNQLLLKSFVVNEVLSVQLVPPSAVVTITPFAPTAQPFNGDVKYIS